MQVTEDRPRDETIRLSAAREPSPDSLPPIVAAAQKFASARNRSALVYFLAQDEPIGTPNVRELADRIGDLEFDELDLVIHSSGGDIHAAYQLVSFLRQRTKKLIACIPRYARSAATLLCIGADSIALDELAAVGPLDAQVYQGSTEGGRPDYKSALNQFKSLERLRGFSLETLRSAAEMLYGKVRRTEDVVKYGIEFVAATSTPLFEKIESHNLGDYSQALSVGEEYGRRLLSRVHKLDPAQSERIVRRLVHGYPSHEYIIDCAELQELGFHAEVLVGEQRRAARELAKHDSMERPRSEGLIMLIDPQSPSEKDRERVEAGGERVALAPAVRLRHRSVVSGSANPWRLSGLESEPAASSHLVPPGPPMFDPPPWERSSSGEPGRYDAASTETDG